MIFSVGTVINIITIAIGSLLGLLLGNRLADQTRQTVIAGLGLFTLAYGLLNFMETQNPLIVVGGLLIGSLLGEWWRIEDGLSRFGDWLQSKVQKSEGSEERVRFLKGFMTASLIFCIGPMAIMGSIQDGLTGDYQTLAIKAILDGFASLAFASSLGIGVLFSILPIAIYQGGITLLAAQVERFVTAGMMTEMTAVGGLLLMGIGISSLLEMKQIRVGNMLPALLIAPLIVFLVSFF